MYKWKQRQCSYGAVGLNREAAGGRQQGKNPKNSYPLDPQSGDFCSIYFHPFSQCRRRNVVIYFRQDILSENCWL